jgi:Cyclic nucleotide-binding domain
VSNGELLSRDELLSGRLQHTSRAAKLLTAIEARTAHMSEETRRAIAAYFVSDEKDFTRRFQLDFLQGVKLVAQSPDHLTVEDLERYAPHWSALVPDDWDLRTALLRLIAQRYPLTDPDLPRIGAALGFEVQTVRDAYRAANGQSAGSGRAEPPSPLPPRYPRSDQLSEDERLLQEAEAGVEWLHLPAGTVLCREGEPGNSLYILISGRLSAVITGEQGH